MQKILEDEMVVSRAKSLKGEGVDTSTVGFGYGCYGG